MLSSRLLARVERRIQETRLPLAGRPLANGALDLPATRDHIYAR